MSCPNTLTEPLSQAGGASGIPAGAIPSRQEFIDLHLQGYKPRNEPGTEGYEAEISWQTTLASQKFERDVATAETFKKIGLPAAKRLLGADYLTSVTIARLGWGGDDTPLRQGDRWLTKDEYLSERLVFPVADLIPDKAMQDYVLKELAHAYTWKIQDAMRTGLVDYHTGEALIGHSAAETGMAGYYLSHAVELTVEDFIAGIRPFMQSMTDSEMRYIHRKAVSEALKNQKDVDGRVLGGHPDLSLALAPWSFRAAEWVEAKIAAMRQPVLAEVKRYIWKNRRYQYREDTTIDLKMAESKRRAARRQNPEWQWEVENTLGDRPCYAVIGRRYLPPQLRAKQKTPPDLLPSLAEQHRAAVEQALQSGMSVPPEVLAGYPELIAKYGW